MTTLAQATQAIYARFVDQWDEDDAVYTFDGENFQEPVDASWIRLSIRHLPSNQDTLGESGNRQFRREALVVINIFTPTNAGRASGDSLAQAARSIFEAVGFDGLNFFESDVEELGIDGLWYQVVVKSKFTYNEMK